MCGLLKIPAVTNANAIVSGSDCELTNKFLQQLAVVTFFHKQVSGSISVTGASSSDGQTQKLSVPVISWPTVIRISFSQDGESWSDEKTIPTNLREGTSIFYCDLLSSMGKAITAKFFRIYPLEWNGTVSESSVRIFPSMRLSILVADLHATRPIAVVTKEGASTEQQSQSILHTLDLLLNSGQIIISTIEFLNSIEEFRKQKRQEESRRVCFAATYSILD